MARINKQQVLSPEMWDKLQHVLSLIYEYKTPVRIEALESRLIDLDGYENLVTKVEEISQKIWQTKSILTSSEAATYLGISDSYLYKLTSTRKIPHYKPNGKILLFSKEEIEKWALSNKIENEAIH